MITPEEYIEQLKKQRRALNSVKYNIDEAICTMERRLETGYEINEASSKIAAKYAFESSKEITETLSALATAEIEY